MTNQPIVLNQKTLEKKIALLDQSIEKLDSKHKEIDASLKNWKRTEKDENKIIGKMIELKNKTEEAIKEYDKKVSELKSRVSAVDNYYNKTFRPLVEKIDDDETGIKKAITETKTATKQLMAEKNNLNKINTELKTSTTEYQKKAKQIDKVIADVDKAIEIISIHKKYIEDSNKEVLLSLEEVKSDTEFIGESQKNVANILNEVEIAKKDIYDLCNDANNTNNKISKYYEIATNKLIAGAFDNQRKNLEEELAKWHSRLVTVTLSLLFFICLLFALQLRLNNWCLNNLSYDFYLRFILATPLIYYVYFCAKQYGNTRKSLERYSYKTTIALSIEAHTELLDKHFKDDKEKILEFSLSSLNKIYDEPYLDDKFKAKLELEKMMSKKNSSENLKDKSSQSNNEIIEILGKILDVAKKIK